MIFKVLYALTLNFSYIALFIVLCVLLMWSVGFLAGLLTSLFSHLRGIFTPNNAPESVD